MGWDKAGLEEPAVQWEVLDKGSEGDTGSGEWVSKEPPVSPWKGRKGWVDGGGGLLMEPR